MFLLYVCLVTCLSAARALTTAERDLFYNSGNYNGFVEVEEHDNTFNIISNGIPDHPTEKLNRNDVGEQDFNFTFPYEPVLACTPGCLPMGIIGLTVHGVALYNPFDNQGIDAVSGSEAERFDSCDGHPDGNDVYHYHQIPDGNHPESTTPCGPYIRDGPYDQLIGIALDGFPIYGPKVSDKQRELTSEDLDECHGRWLNGRYQYHATYDIPYIIGCFRGTTANVNRATVSYNCDMVGKTGEACVCSPPGTLDPDVCPKA